MGEQNIWLNGIMGFIVGDALGSQVQFMDRQLLKKRGLVTGMEGYGRFNKTKGSFTDVGSMVLATLNSIIEQGKIAPYDIMDKYVSWLADKEKYKSYGPPVYIRSLCYKAIMEYQETWRISIHGQGFEESKDNSSIIRILPVCLYAYIKKIDMDETMRLICEISGLTNPHKRCMIGCGFYYFAICAILDNDNEKNLYERLKKGIAKAFSYFETKKDYMDEVKYFERLRNLTDFMDISEEKIQSNDDVVNTFEAVVWSLLKTDNVKDALLTAVNLGNDSTAIGALVGALSGIFYSYEGIPMEWLEVIQRREWVEEMCYKANIRFSV